MFGGNFAPAGWMLCEGQQLPISQYETLFNLIGTTYGGDGQQTFNLPDLRGRLPIHQGTLSGNGTTFTLGQRAGEENVTLTVPQIPSHTHPATGASTGGATTASGNTYGNGATIYSTAAPSVAMNPATVGPTGGSQPHSNFMPYLCVDFIISLFGVFPTQN
jgi:microcystin-dependent protein